MIYGNRSVSILWKPKRSMGKTNVLLILSLSGWSIQRLATLGRFETWGETLHLPCPSLFCCQRWHREREPGESGHRSKWLRSCCCLWRQHKTWNVLNETATGAKGFIILMLEALHWVQVCPLQQSLLKNGFRSNNLTEHLMSVSLDKTAASRGQVVDN